MQYATRHLNFSFIYGFLNSSTEFLEKYEKPKIDAQLYILLYTDFQYFQKDTNSWVIWTDTEKEQWDCLYKV